jgi:hypothetical protein
VSSPTSYKDESGATLDQSSLPGGGDAEGIASKGAGEMARCAFDSGSTGCNLGVWGRISIGDDNLLLLLGTGDNLLVLELEELKPFRETGIISILDTSEKDREAIVEASSNESIRRTLAQETFGAAYLRSGVLRRSIMSSGRNWGKPGANGPSVCVGCSEAVRAGCFRGGMMQRDSGLREDVLATGLRDGVRGDD